MIGTIRAGSCAAVILLGGIVISHCAQAQGWTSAKEMRNAVIARTLEYFRRKDAGRYAAAYSLFGSTTKASISLRAYRNLTVGRRSKFGAARGRKITKLSWYRRNSPTGGVAVFAAVDVTSSFERLAVHCGYLIWQVFRDRKVLLVREEENFVTKAIGRRLSASKMRDVRRKFGCRD